MDETVDKSPVTEKTGENEEMNGVEGVIEENHTNHTEKEENHPKQAENQHEQEENLPDQEENNEVESDPEEEELEEDHEDIEEMEITADLPDIEVEACRLCDDVNEKMFNIFEDNPEGYQLIGLIKENLPIVLYKTDPLSKQVCEKCVLNLQIISSLKKRSRQTQEKYVDKLKAECDTNDKNVLLFLGCTGSKLVDNGEDEEEEEEELKDQATSTDDLTVLCANCKTSILDASTVNGEIELSSNLHDVIKESLRRNRVVTGDNEKVLRERKVQPLYNDDSLCSSLTDTPAAGADDLSPSEECPSDVESEESDERPAKRRKIDESSQEIQDEINRALAQKSEINGVTDEESLDKEEDSSEKNDSEEEAKNEEDEKAIKEREEEIKKEKEEQERKEKEEKERIEQIMVTCEEIFKEEPDFTFEPLTLLEAVLNTINSQNVTDFQPEHFKKQSTVCTCKVCNEKFKNAKLLALHEPTHMDVDMEDKIDIPAQWSKDHPFAKIRNKWLTRFDENFEDDEDDDVDVETYDKEDELLVENTEKTMAMSKKDEVVLVDMKPMVNGVYLGDYTKEERKAFYQCMRIGGQTKRFCPLCRYCFKDNWAIESHYFSFACHYTCRHCGMRFNKQRHRFDEHTKEHTDKKEPISDKIYTASKVHNTMPKVIQPDKIKKQVIQGDPEKPREIRLEDYMSPPIITKGGFDQRGTRYSNNLGHGQLPPGYQAIKVKEEPKDLNNLSLNNKSQNQAYFCRKCYKVFFKLDEFNAHSRNCDYSSFTPAQKTGSSPNALPKMAPIKIKHEGMEKNINGGISTGGRPVRNCAKDIGPYKDEVYIPRQILNDTIPGPPQSFICHICGTPFPTIYSRNSHMRIHKGEQAGAPAHNNGPSPQMVVQQNILRQRLQQQQQQHQQNYNAQRMLNPGLSQQQRQMLIQRKIQQQKAMQQQRQQQQEQQNYPHFEEIRVKEEPVDSFEPMVEIHEGHESSPSPPPPQAQVPRAIGGGAVSLTPIVKKPALNPNIQKLIANNPNISLAPSKKTTPQVQRNGERNLIKNQGGYQGPYAPSTQSQSRDVNVTPQMRYITVSPNLMPNDDNKSYKCSSCWEAFSNKSHLYFHKKNQCEGSRFPCPFCKKRFGTEAAYSSHIFYSHPE